MSIGCTKKSYTSDGAISKTVTSSNDTPNYIRSTYLPNNFFVTVMESGSPKSILVELYNSDSVLETSKTNSQTSYSATRPDVLGFVNSEVLVVYSSAISTVVTRAQIYGEVFHTDMDLKISVTRLTQQDNCIYTVPLVKKFQNDSFVLIASGYKSGHARKVYGRILEANFTSIYPLTDEFEVTGEEHSVYYYDLALCGDESFVVAWSEPTDEYDAIYAKRYSRNGDLLIDKTQMYVFNNGDSIEPSATCSDDNMISLSWRTYNRDVVNTYVVYAQVFDSDFDAFGDSFRVDYSPEYGSDQKAPMVASYGNRLAVSYQESLWYYYTLYKIYTKPSENNKIPDQDFSLTSHKYSYTCPWDTFVVPYTDTMTYSAEFGDAAGWLTYHASNRSFEGVPPYTYSVVYSNIKEIVSDSCGNTADSQFQVTVVNQDPIVDQGLQTQYVEIPQGLNYQFDSNTFQDPEEQSLTYTENVNGQTWINFDGITRTFTGNPPNSCGEIYSGIEVIAADDCGNTVTDSFTIETTNQAPIVDSPLQDQTIYISGEGLDYQFSSNTFKDPEEQNMTYTENVNGHSWINFDGITRTFMGNPPHSCGEIFSGIEVTAEDDCGNTVTDSFTIEVTNQAPIVDSLLQDQTIYINGEGLNYQFGSNTFKDPEEQSLTYTENLNGHSWINFDQITLTFTGNRPYSCGEIFYGIEVTAQDDCGNTITDSFTIEVINQAPIVDSPLQDQTIYINGEGLDYQFGSNTFKDPEEQSLTYTENVNGHSWINFDDTTLTFTGNPPNRCGEIFSGIEVTAEDDCGNTVTDSFTIEIINQAPIVDSPLQDQTIYISGEGLDYQFDSNTFKDPEEQSLTYTENVNGHSWINFDDTTLTFTGNPPHSCTEIFSGIEVTAEDDCGNTVTDSFTIEVINQAPIVDSSLQDQTIYINGEGLDYQFGSNTFKDPEEKSLTYTENVNGQSWINFDEITRTFTGNPPHSCGEIYTGIEVTAADDCGNTVTDSFTIETTNQAPIVDSPLQDQTIYINGEGLDYQFDSNTFQDPEEKILTYTENVNGHSWINFDEITRTFTGNPPHSCGEIFSGIEVTAEDDCGNTITNSFAIEVTNQAPIVDSPLQDQTIYISGEGLDYQFGSNAFKDPEEQSLTYMENVNGHSWINFDDTTLTFTGNPPYSCGEIFSGIEVTAQDDCGNTVTDSFTIEVTNQAPIVNSSLQDQTIYISGEGLDYQFDSNTFKDPEEKSLTYTENVNGHSWINFDEITRTFTGNPPHSCTEILSGIEVTAEDDCGNTVTDSFTIEVTNQAPIVDSPLQDQTIYINGEGLDYQFGSNAFQDPEEQSLTYMENVNGHSWINFDDTTRTFTGNPPYSCGEIFSGIQVTAQDDCGNTVTDSFTIEVTNQAPIVDSPLQDQTIYINGEGLDYQFGSNTFQDPEEQSLTYTENVNGHSWINFDDTTLTFTGNPPYSCTEILSGIEVTAEDDCGNTITDSFTIEVTNQAPIIDSPLQDQTIYINGEGLDYQFSSNTFQDPEEKSLTYTENVNGHSWINFDDITRTFTGNPPHSCGEIYLGIEVTAEDDCGNTVTDSFTIETTNQVPKNQISLVDQSIDLDQNENLFYQFDEDSFQDPEGKPLDYSAYLSNNSPLPDWINFNETSRTFEGEPLPNQCQEDLEIKVIVKDDCLQKNFQLFKVSLFKKGTEKKKNLNDHQAEAGKQLNYVFDSDTFSDPFNQGLTYSATLENDELLPSWMNFDSDARQFTGVAEGCSQTLKIKVTAKDDCQNTDFAFFSLHIQNLDPSINEDISDASYPTSTAFEFSIKSDTFLDPENGVLTYSANEYNLETLPEWLNFDNKKLSFFGNCPNTAQNIWITVIAKDECNQENHLNFKFEIRNDNNNDDVDDDDTKTNNDDEDGNNTSTQTVIFSVALCIMFLIIVLFIINIWLKKVNKKKEHLKRNDKENVKDLEMKNYHDNYLNKSNDKKDRKSQQTFDSNSNSVGSSSSNSSSSSSSSSSSDEESD